MISRLDLKALISVALLTVPLTVIADDNAWPVAITDLATSQTQESITIPVTDNDIGNNLEITEVNTTTVGLGSAAISPDKKSVIYQSAASFVELWSRVVSDRNSKPRSGFAQLPRFHL